MFKSQLQQKQYQLVSLNESHASGLKLAAQNPALWPLIQPKDQGFDAFWDGYYSAMKTGHENADPFAYLVLDTAGTVVGSTRYYDISAPNKRLAIGYTWYKEALWGTGINAECKYMLLSQTFDTLGWNRVEFHVDSRNKRSLAAMKKLGATEEGLLRKHKIVQGDYLRDTVILSIIQDDWPQVKHGLLGRMEEKS